MYFNKRLRVSAVGALRRRHEGAGRDDGPAAISTRAAALVAAGVLMASVSLIEGARAQGLHEAVEKAWERQPIVQARGYRADELAARTKAAGAWSPLPPSVAVRQRSDRLNRDAGVSEFETELAVPLWLPGQRDREAAVVAADSDLQRDALVNAKLKLAGDVRDAFWQARAAEADRDAAAERLRDSATLLADVERRLAAGDLARTDFNQAKGAERTAQSALVDADGKLARAQQAYRTLTGLTTLPQEAEAEATATSRPSTDDHPALRQLQRTAAAADARLRLAAQVTRDNPELTLGYRRERGPSPDPFTSTLFIGIRVPFATEARNDPKISAANAEFIEASTALVRERERIEAEAALSLRELQQARRALALAEERQTLAAETDRLLGRAFAFGEIDLPTRLRTAAERYAAQAEVARSRIDAGRAVSRFNQSLGVLP